MLVPNLPINVSFLNQNIELLQLHNNSPAFLQCCAWWYPWSYFQWCLWMKSKNTARYLALKSGSLRGHMALAGARAFSPLEQPSCSSLTETMKTSCIVRKCIMKREVGVVTATAWKSEDKKFPVFFTWMCEKYMHFVLLITLQFWCGSFGKSVLY